jgi:Fe-S cluster biogenesis protein NfuA
LVEIIDDKHVKVRLEGACTSCNFSISTMKAGVETTIKKYVPQIETVENIK